MKATILAIVAACFFLPADVASAAAVSMDQVFTIGFPRINQEIQDVANLIQSQSQDTEARALAKTIANDYALANHDVPSSLSITVGPQNRIFQMNEKAGLEVLGSLSGAAFDRAAVEALLDCQQVGLRLLSAESANDESALQTWAGLVGTALTQDFARALQLNSRLSPQS